MRSDKKKILITGGAGFIGSHLVAGLLKRGDCEVGSLDNYSTGKEENHIAERRHRQDNGIMVV